MENREEEGERVPGREKESSLGRKGRREDKGRSSFRGKRVRVGRGGAEETEEAEREPGKRRNFCSFAGGPSESPSLPSKAPPSDRHSLSNKSPEPGRPRSALALFCPSLPCLSGARHTKPVR